MGNIEEEIDKFISGMKNNTINNYVLAGLCSSLIGGGTFGKVRLFEKVGHQHDFITPHSHRFDFLCIVLCGWVENTIWEEAVEHTGDFYELSVLEYSGEIGKHSKKKDGRDYYSFGTIKYHAGDTYSMKAHQIHSIKFSKGAKVLFFEGPNVSTESVILEPVFNGETIQTYKNEPWMFS